MDGVTLRGAAGVGAAPGAQLQAAQPDPTATTLMLHGLRAGIFVSNSYQLRLEAFQIDMARLPYTWVVVCIVKK